MRMFLLLYCNFLLRHCWKYEITYLITISSKSTCGTDSWSKVRLRKNFFGVRNQNLFQAILSKSDFWPHWLYSAATKILTSYDSWAYKTKRKVWRTAVFFFRGFVCLAKFNATVKGIFPFGIFIVIPNFRCVGNYYNLIKSYEFQTNPAAAEVMYDTIRNMVDLDKDTTLVDLCCGVGKKF